MKIARLLFVLGGLAALAWGAVLLVQFAVPAPNQAIVAAGWLIGGPLVHDIIIGPICALAGLAIARILSPRWRAPLMAGLVVSAVLVVLAVPLVWRAYGTPPLPGLHDRDPVPGLLVALAVVWIVAILVAVFGVLRRRPRDRRSSSRPPTAPGGSLAGSAGSAGRPENPA